MKAVVYEDAHGRKHRRLLRDNDSEDNPEIGVPLDPIGLELVDWNGLEDTLYNWFVENGIHDVKTLNEKQGLSTVAAFAKRFVLAGFQNAESNVK